jgi:hypothetical protein
MGTKYLYKREEMIDPLVSEWLRIFPNRPEFQGTIYSGRCRKNE